MSDSAPEPRDGAERVEPTVEAEPAAERVEPTEELSRPTEKIARPEPERTLERPLVDAESPLPADDGNPTGADEQAGPGGAAPRLRDATRPLGDYLRERAALLGHLARRHRAVTTVLALLACVVVALLGVSFVRAAALPDAATIEADARELLAVPEFSGGTYGTDTPLVTQGVEVRSVARADSAPEGSSAAFGAAGYATAEVVITYGGQSVSATRAATLSYALVDGTWEVLPGAADGGVAWHATAGVDQQKVLRNAHLLLERAEERSGGGAQGLADLYADADVTLASSTFDEAEQMDTLELSYTRGSSFETYTCQLTATFSFGQASGQWSVADVSVAEGALTPGLDALTGVWEGSFQSQQTEGAKCLGGRAAGLEIRVSEAANGEIRGTVSGLSHYHEHPADDAPSCEGDHAFEDVAFSARLMSGTERAGDEADGSLVFVLDLPEDVGGTTRVTLRFGSADDPDRVEALVESSYTYTQTILFIPSERTVTYTDEFTLTRAPEE